MFAEVSRGIAVRVEPTYLAHESDPDEGRYVWAYRVQIENQGDRTVQLISRRWLITDSNGVQREVAGRGVVGLQPTIPPGETFEYTSGCPLTTPSGIMVGSYSMVDEYGANLEIRIPAFSLDSPNHRRVLN
jgi:ApaG protein